MGQSPLRSPCPYSAVLPGGDSRTLYSTVVPAGTVATPYYMTNAAHPSERHRYSFCPLNWQMSYLLVGARGPHGGHPKWSHCDVTDAVALFPRFPHLVEVGRIELPLGVRTMCRDLFPVTPAYLPMIFIHLVRKSFSFLDRCHSQNAKSSKDVYP